jgi:malonyl-CoA O-methyltransferase
LAEIDKRQARRAFARAAPRYDDVAVLQQEIGRRMLERLELVRMVPQRILDAGAGTGIATDALSCRYPEAEVIALDFALPMLQQAQRRVRSVRCLCADLEHLPLADGCIDLIFSNAALQWSNDLDHTFREFLRVLRPGGLLMFTTFGTDTLKELRTAWATVDGESHVSRFPDLHDVGDALVRSRFAEPVMDVDRMQLTYDQVEDLMEDLKVLGAHNVTQARPRGLTGRGRISAMTAAYEGFRREGRLPASYEVIYGHAWAPATGRAGEVISISPGEIGPPALG